MSTKLNGHDGNAGRGSYEADGLPVNRDVTFEVRDINVATVVKQLIYLAITIVVALLICVPILKFLTGMAADGEAPMAPVRAQMTAHEREMSSFPPDPRLQGVPGHETDGQEDLRTMQKQDAEVNDSFKWIDKANGVAQIPVEDAMKLIVERAKNSAAAGTVAEKKK